MDERAVTFLRRTIIRIITSSPLLTKLLWDSDNLHDDLEWQYATLGTDEISNINLQNSSSSGAEASRQRTLSQMGEDDSRRRFSSDDPRARIEPLDEPTRVVVHDDRAGKHLALLITDDVVFQIQKVIDAEDRLRYVEKQLRRVQKEISGIQSMGEKAQIDLEEDIREDEESSEGKHLREKMRDAHGRRDNIGRRIEMNQSNLESVQSTSHTFFRDILGKANLLKIPHDECETPSEPDLDDATSEPDSIVLDPKEAFDQTVHAELMDLSQEHDEAQRKFDTLEDDYYDNKEEYQAAYANGEVSIAQSEFDRIFVDIGRQVTRRLIESGDAYKKAKRRAKALGVVGSTWGDDIGLGAYEAPSIASDEMRKYQNSRDWSFVQNWLKRHPFAESALLQQSEPEEKLAEVDDWDARLDDMWDSISAVDHLEEHRDNYELWNRIQNGSVDDDGMDESLGQEQDNDMSPMEQE